MGRIRRLFLSLIIFSPIIFTIKLTRNPHLIQSILISILSAIILLDWAIISHSKEKISLPRTSLDKPICIFFLICIASIVSGVLYNRHFARAVGIAGFKGLFFLFVNFILIFYITVKVVRDGVQLKKIFYTISIPATVSSIYAILQFFNIDPFWKVNRHPFGTRSFSTFGNPNFLASFLVMSLLGMLALFLGEKMVKKKLVWLAVIVINLWALVITQTRSAWLGLFVGGILFFCLLSRQIIRQNKLWIISGIILLVCLGGYFNKNLKVKVIPSLNSQAIQQRMLMWRVSWKMFTKRPIIGQGWGTFGLIYPFQQAGYLKIPKYAQLRTHAFQSHNFILNILAETGIVGLGIIIWLLISLLKTARQADSQCPELADKVLILACSGGTMAMFVDNLLNKTLWIPTCLLLFSIYMGIVAARVVPSVKYSRHPALICEGLGILAIFIISFSLLHFTSEILFFKGSKYAKEKQYKASIGFYQKAEKIFPLDYKAPYWLGNSYVKSGLNLLAAKEYVKAVQIDPGYDETWFNLAQVCFLLRKWPQAIQSYENVLRINPNREGIRERIEEAGKQLMGE